MSKPANTGHPPLRVPWRRTWSFTRDDYAAHHDPRSYCRIMKVVGGPQAGRWRWAAAANQIHAGSGYEDSVRAAALAAELCMFTALEAA